MSKPVVLDARVVAGSGGGPDKTILLQPRFLVPHGFHNVVVYLYPPADPGFEVLRERAALESAPLEAIPDHGPRDFRILRQLLTILRTTGTRIWHGHDYKTNLLGLMLRRWHPMKLVTTLHGWVHHTPRTPLYYWLDRRTLRYYDRVFAVSPDLVTEARRVGVPRSRAILLENGIDLEHYTYSPIRRSQNRFVILGVGRLSAEKAWDDLIRAVAWLRNRGKAVELQIAGDGPERDALSALARELEVTESVRFLGWQTDLRPIFMDADLMVLPSLREGLPNVLLEAMALGVPVVATAIAGIPRLLDSGRCGVLVSARQPDALAQAIWQLAEQPQRRAELAFLARERIEQHYSFQARMAAVAHSYRQLLAPPSARHGKR
jgi:glycosyltransferase involved in cell wall biosynthesis